MQDLAMAIGEYRYKGFKLFIDHVHPDLFLSHDDWGAKNNLFIRPQQPMFTGCLSILEQAGCQGIFFSSMIDGLERCI